MKIRTVDGGGAGFRRADIEDGKIGLLTKSIGSLKNIKEVIDFIASDLPKDTDGIAIAMAAILHNHDYIEVAPNAHFLDEIKLATEISDKLKIKTAVFNDMEAAVAGMASLLPKDKYFMGITWSSGIGLKIWQKGELISPITEAGHMLMDPSPQAQMCGCGKRGHVEAYLGGNALGRRVLAKAKSAGISIPDIDPNEFLIKSYLKQEAWAEDLFNQIGEEMGIFLANLQTVFILPLIVWKGTFALEALKYLEPTIRRKMKHILIDPSWSDSSHLRFEFSPDPNHDSLIGAASFFEKIEIS